jgi:hypothetical protein
MEVFPKIVHLLIFVSAREVSDVINCPRDPVVQRRRVGCVNSSAVRICPVCSEIELTHPTGFQNYGPAWKRVIPGHESEF